MYLGSFDINDYMEIPADCHRFSSGVAYLPTALTYSIYKDGSTTGLFENVDMVPASPFDAIVGHYMTRIQLTAASGFVAGSTYHVLIRATVDGVAAIQSHIFQIGIKSVETLLESRITGAVGTVADLVTALMVPQKNVALANFPLPMTLTGTTTQAGAGLTCTVLINKDKAGWGACAGTKYVTDAQGVGWVDWAAADLNANTVGVIVTATGCNPLMFSLLPK